MREQLFGGGRRWLALLVSSLPLIAMANEPSVTQNNAGGEANSYAAGFERLSRGTAYTMCGIADARKSLLCWGSAGTVEWPMFVGRPKQNEYKGPVLAPRGEIPADAKLEKVSVEYKHMCALTDTGGVYCWGEDYRGSLGIGTGQLGRSAPAPIADGEVPAGVRFVDMTTEAQGGCVVGNDGKLYCWGDNGLIPNPSLSTTGHSAVPVATIFSDIRPGVALLKVAIGRNRGCALADDGNAYCWTRGSRTPEYVLPGEVPSGAKLVDIQIGDDLPCALADNGQIFCWGSSSFGRRFGNGSSGSVSTDSPLAVSDGEKPKSAKFVAFTVGGISIASCGVADNGKTYCWGNGYRGSLGDGDLNGHEALTPVAVVKGQKKASADWVSVNCATYTCTALADNGLIYNWGGNDFLMLSRDDQFPDSAQPLRISRPARP
jgi:alpha-tubulin suppressor-like RCC1 family protein